MSMSDRMRVLVVFGGRSGEHEVSVMSARTVVDAVEVLGHEAVGVGITRDGVWLRSDPRDVERVTDGEPFPFVVGGRDRGPVDVAFPVLHGPHGEDGTIQGLFEVTQIPYVGSGVDGSVIGINKVVQKRLFSEAQIPVVDFVAFDRAGWEREGRAIRDAVDKLGYPSFAKPVNLGSSVGISKVHGPDELDAAAERALRHDDEVIVEAAGFARELEVGVLGEPPEVSVVGEVVPDGEFYDYRAKYRGAWTQLQIPADVPGPVAGEAADLALRAFRTARCEGLARVDFFFDAATETLIVNEVNTLPGLTPASMFPKVWEASGVPFREVVRRLIDHALIRARRRRALEDARASAHDEEVGG